MGPPSSPRKEHSYGVGRPAGATHLRAPPVRVRRQRRRSSERATNAADGRGRKRRPQFLLGRWAAGPPAAQGRPDFSQDRITPAASTRVCSRSPRSGAVGTKPTSNLSPVARALSAAVSPRIPTISASLKSARSAARSATSSRSHSAVCITASSTARATSLSGGKSSASIRSRSPPSSGIGPGPPETGTRVGLPASAATALPLADAGARQGTGRVGGAVSPAGPARNRRRRNRPRPDRVGHDIRAPTRGEPPQRAQEHGPEDRKRKTAILA